MFIEVPRALPKSKEFFLIDKRRHVLFLRLKILGDRRLPASRIFSASSARPWRIWSAVVWAQTENDSSANSTGFAGTRSSGSWWSVPRPRFWRAKYHSNIKPQAVLATLWTFEARYDLPVVFASNKQDGARKIERWAFYFARETVEAVNDLWRAVHPKG
jgi:hypothetical protein